MRKLLAPLGYMTGTVFLLWLAAGIIMALTWIGKRIYEWGGVPLSLACALTAAGCVLGMVIYLDDDSVDPSM